MCVCVFVCVCICLYSSPVYDFMFYILIIILKNMYNHNVVI